MLWEVEIRPTEPDSERERVRNEYELLTHGRPVEDLVAGSLVGLLVPWPLKILVDNVLQGQPMPPVIDNTILCSSHDCHRDTQLSIAALQRRRR